MSEFQVSDNSDVCYGYNCDVVIIAIYFFLTISVDEFQEFLTFKYFSLLLVLSTLGRV